MEYSNIGNKYYWVLVTGTGTTSDGYNYIDLSITDYDGLLAPEIGDSIVMLGSRVEDDPLRASAIYISAYSSLDVDYIKENMKVVKGLTAPFVAQYKGITGFNSLARYRQSYFDSNGARFVGDITLGTSEWEAIQDRIDDSSKLLSGSLYGAILLIDTSGILARVEAMDSHLNELGLSGNLSGIIYNEVYSQVQQSADSIKATVKSDIMTELSGDIHEAVNQAVLEIDTSGIYSKVSSIEAELALLSGSFGDLSGLLDNLTGTIATIAQSEVSQTAGDWNVKISLLSGNLNTLSGTIGDLTGTVQSMIDVSISGIVISSSNISLEGYTTINGGLSIDEEGNLSTKNADISAKSFSIVDEDQVAPVILLTTYHSGTLGTPSSSTDIGEGMPCFIINYGGNRYLINAILLSNSSAVAKLYVKNYASVVTEYDLISTTNSDNVTIYQQNNTYSPTGDYYEVKKVHGAVPVFSSYDTTTQKTYKSKPVYVLSHDIFRVTKYNVTGSALTANGIMYIVPKVIYLNGVSTHDNKTYFVYITTYSTIPSENIFIVGVNSGSWYEDLTCSGFTYQTDISTSSSAFMDMTNKTLDIKEYLSWNTDSSAISDPLTSTTSASGQPSTEPSNTNLG